MAIQYPIIKIDSQNWIDDEDLIPLFDEFIYSSKESIFREYFYNKEFVDCAGNIYKVIDRFPPVSIWRNLFRFLPGVYKVKLVFIKTDKRIDLDDLKKDIIKGIKRFDTVDTKEISANWIKEIEDSSSIKELLTGKN